MNFTKLCSFFLLLFAIYWSFYALMPSGNSTAEFENSDYKLSNALEHVKNISKTPHAVGFPGHEKVMTYVVSQLKMMGLVVSTQEGYVISDWGNLCKAKNILARIKGTEGGKALLLLSHYDSSPHSSYGASDDASGVATILEAVRALLAKGEAPKNDIIILISDAEELGLNGAELFVNKHPWAKDVGLVLNFEARGSGGSSYMLVETNRGNSRLIREFTKANPKFPVANSLAYSIYKMLPNDTDLTVFREDRDIDGFNLAFIDDHYDYHTVLDSYERMDKSSLAHQAHYLIPLLDHFSTIDLSNLRSLSDTVYFNMPFFQLVSYPFEWIWLMFGVACLLFLLLIFHGFRKNEMDTKSILLGFIPVAIILIINGVAGFLSWPALQWWYPWYNDILHGFTYNGHQYIVAMTFFALGICLFVYHKFKGIRMASLLVAPIVVWMIICGAAAVYLKGASFFIIPVFGILASLLVYINQEKPNPLLLLFLGLPAVFMCAPFIQMFPVGLGLKMLIASTLLTSLLFFLLLPLFGAFNKFRTLGVLVWFLCAIYSIKAHLNFGYDEESPKPSSLLYVYDSDSQNAQWASYDEVMIDWNARAVPSNEEKEGANTQLETIASKYHSQFKQIAKAEIKPIPLPDITVTRDTVLSNSRQLTLCVTPRRAINRLEVFTNDIVVEKCSVNGVKLSDYYLENRRNGKLVTHFVSDNAYTEIEMTVPKDKSLEFTFYESSNDLISTPLLNVPERPNNSIAMPFVLNDAILLIKRLTIE